MMSYREKQDSESEDGLETFEYSVPLSPRTIQELEPSDSWSGGGTCGVYLLCNKAGNGVAIFKPQDEETVPEHAVGMVVGSNLYRERAAYLVSKELGGLGVPATTIRSLSHPKFGSGQKLGSLQRFVPFSNDMSDLGPSGIPADQVHKIGCLDILLFNLDRHEGNILLRRNKQNELVPIDHGLVLPEIVSKEHGVNRDLLRGIFFAWQTWPQARTPFSAKLRRVLCRLTPSQVDNLVAGLRMDPDISLHLSESSWTTLKIGAAILRIFARHTLADMSKLVSMHLPDLLHNAWSSAQNRLLCDSVENIDLPSKDEETETHPDKDYSEILNDIEMQALALRSCTNLVNDGTDKNFAAWERRFLSLVESALLGFVSSLPQPDCSTSKGADEVHFQSEKERATAARHSAIEEETEGGIGAIELLIEPKNHSLIHFERHLADSVSVASSDAPETDGSAVEPAHLTSGRESQLPPNESLCRSESQALPQDSRFVVNEEPCFSSTEPPAPAARQSVAMRSAVACGGDARNRHRVGQSLARRLGTGRFHGRWASCGCGAASGATGTAAEKDVIGRGSVGSVAR